jgi:hypothetical protein
MNREKGCATNRNTTKIIETGKNVPSAGIIGMIKDASMPTAAVTIIVTRIITAAVTIKEVMITTAIVDTGNAHTAINVITRITTIEDTGMRTTAIGIPGNNGTRTQKPIRTFAGTETTTAKTRI